MGSAKDEMMRLEELEPMFEWIEENYGDDAGEEGSETWDQAVQAYEAYCEKLQGQENEWRLQEEIEWYIHTQTQIAKFDTQIRNVLEILEVEVSNEAKFSLLVMLHGHIVAAVESYLASTFIREVTNSEELIKKLIETDPVFSEMTFTLKEIYKKHEALKLTVAIYLRDLIFHKLSKVKLMFKNVLNCDFGDISWLFKAVDVRHHCVHRAGLDKDGNKVNLSKESIIDLVHRSSKLVHFIEVKVDRILFPEEKF
jgi:hypothetical protein